jgi:coenzyme PQQ precursor peptide PqqA
MTAGLGRPAVRRDDAPHRNNPCGNPRRPCMTWTTPTATDFRFGFEITMYVAAR